MSPNYVVIRLFSVYRHYRIIIAVIAVIARVLVTPRRGSLFTKKPYELHYDATHVYLTSEKKSPITVRYIDFVAGNDVTTRLINK